MDNDYRHEARILADGFEKGMTAFGESIERGLKAIAETLASEKTAGKIDYLAPNDITRRYKEFLSVECEREDPHEEHYALVGGVPQKCSGKGQRTMREVRCFSPYEHQGHEWTAKGGGAEGDEEIYCPGFE